MNVESILAAQPDAVRALARADVSAWQTLLEYLVVRHPQAAPPELVVALIEERDEVQVWHDRAKQAAAQIDSALFTTIRSATRPFEAWLGEGIRAALPSEHPAALKSRYAELVHHAKEGSIELVRAFADEVRRILGPGALLADVLLLLARRAHEDDDHQAALAAASNAEQLFTSLGDAPNANVAARVRAATLLRMGKLDAAFGLLDRALVSRGPLFGGQGTRRFIVSTDAKQIVLDDAALVAMWADAATPEWVRALGGIAETFGGASLDRRFGESLSAMAGGPAPVSDLEVVLRQASERGFDKTALAAAELLADRHASDLDAAAIVGSYFAQQGALDRAWKVYARAAEANDGDGLAWLCAAELAGGTGDARRLLENARRGLDASDPALAARVELAAIEIETSEGEPSRADRLWKLFESMQSDFRFLAESKTGHALADRTIAALLRGRDRRAVTAAEILLQAKLELWGFCPAAWLEQHNLGSVHAELGELGDPAEARRHVEQAIAGLRQDLAPEHPHLRMAERTLAKIDRARNGETSP